ncbi:MAG TPA: sigma-70 family RNA polymerase sigma factor [Thermoanaerobaculia bacterium]
METSFEQLYETLAPLLHHIAVQKFGLPEEDADDLVHEVALSYLARSEEVKSPRQWFVGAISNACRSYWRRLANWPTAELSEVDWRVESAIERQVSARQLLLALAPRDRRILWLRFAEGCSVMEVAGAIGVSHSRAEKLIRRSLERARRVAGTAVPDAEESDETHSRRGCRRARATDTFATWRRGRPGGGAAHLSTSFVRRNHRRRLCNKCKKLAARRRNPPVRT